MPSLRRVSSAQRRLLLQTQRHGHGADSNRHKRKPARRGLAGCQLVGKAGARARRLVHRDHGRQRKRLHARLPSAADRTVTREAEQRRSAQDGGGVGGGGVDETQGETARREQQQRRGGKAGPPPQLVGARGVATHGQRHEARGGCGWGAAAGDAAVDGPGPGATGESQGFLEETGKAQSTQSGAGGALGVAGRACWTPPPHWWQKPLPMWSRRGQSGKGGCGFPVRDLFYGIATNSRGSMAPNPARPVPHHTASSMRVGSARAASAARILHRLRKHPQQIGRQVPRPDRPMRQSVRRDRALRQGPREHRAVGQVGGSHHTHPQLQRAHAALGQRAARHRLGREGCAAHPAGRQHTPRHRAIRHLVARHRCVAQVVPADRAVGNLARADLQRQHREQRVDPGVRGRGRLRRATRALKPVGLLKQHRVALIRVRRPDASVARRASLHGPDQGGRRSLFKLYYPQCTQSKTPLPLRLGVRGVRGVRAHGRPSIDQAPSLHAPLKPNALGRRGILRINK
eukprot:scaffold25305_cov99-Isochrysis_galbana.AAC.2